MIFQKKIFIYTVLGTAVLSLGACGTNHPNAMPSGYTYHHDEYKSPIPPTSKKITVEQRRYMDAAQAEQFRHAVYDLLERLTMRAGMPPKPVYIVAPDPMTTFYANIDNDLRESMRHIGYAISDTPTDAYIFTYDAVPIKQSESSGVQAGANNVSLTLRVFNSLGDDAQQLTEETGQYFIQGADTLNISSSLYKILPAKKKVVAQEVPIEEPPVVTSDPISAEPVIAEPAMMEPIITEPMMAEPIKAEPVIVSEPVMIEPDIAEVAVEKPKVKTKKPSRDDIIIINRGDDKQPVEDVVEEMVPIVTDPQPDALQDAIPSKATAIRGRVSLPADY